jgi:hypothetical protein
MQNRSPTTTAPATDGWSRPAVTFRLTADRKRALRDLLDGADAMASPTGALDMAIELAAAARDFGSVETQEPAPHSEIVTMLDSLRMQVQSLASAVEDWSARETRMSTIDVERVAKHDANEAHNAHAPRLSGEAISPTPIGAWLDAEAALSTNWLVAKIHWLGKRPAGSGTALWHVEMRELGRSGAFSIQKDKVVHISLGPAPSIGPLSRLENEAGAILSCARSSVGWTLSLRVASDEGKLGEPFLAWSI